ncbi:hypothetical protein K2173_009965 [Erythroxylum novogranatense]|uniref:DUF7653 domain-containing protein n=1 Tax=Erythroxylum novogranatense TaxID=1862640 RepID=A0AAV8T0Q5_9ROSI|nr:hypothetical protein K2173_009965 [Erythroxylum novogranatense]
MKKLFFFRSSSNKCDGSADSPTSAGKQVYWEMPAEGRLSNQCIDKAEIDFGSSRGFFSKSRKQERDSPSPCLRRSQSLSSDSIFAHALEQRRFLCTDDHTGSPSSVSNHSRQQQSVCWFLITRWVLTPEKQTKTKTYEMASTLNACRLERLGSSASSKSHHDSSTNSSSSNVLSKVLDRYVDGQQLYEERSKPKSNPARSKYTGNGNAGAKLPPRVQCTAPSSPTGRVKDKSRSCSFRDAKSACFSPRDWVEHAFGHESPSTIAKNVVEKLSQIQAFSKASAKEFDRDIPITIEDIYSGSMNKCFNSKMNSPAQKSFSMDQTYDAIDSYYAEDISGCQKQNSFLPDIGDVNSVANEDAIDVELQRRSKQAEERVVFLSEELDQESFHQDCGFDVPSLVQTIRNLMADKVSLAIEVSSFLKSRIAERDSAMEEFRLAKAELESRTQRLEKEKSELQTALEKELDRRSNDYSTKLEKCLFEEHRLRERVRELAEQNVCLQMEVSSFHQRETESKSMITHSEQQIKHLTSRIEDVTGDNQDLKQRFSELGKKYKSVQEDLYCVKRKFEQKDNECKELQKSVTRSLRTCSDQEKTIVGLQQVFSEEFEQKQSLSTFDKQVEKMQMEQMRLTGIEMTLRREVEFCRFEIDSLRSEKINLLDRLKDNGKEIDAVTFKLDDEMQTRVCCLQNQSLGMLNESGELCSKLLEYIQGKSGQLSESKKGTEFATSGLDGQFLVESEMKIQGFKRGTESLTRSLQTVSSLLREKFNLVALKPHTPSNSESKQLDYQTIDNARIELKAESLLTTLLREKLYSKRVKLSSCMLKWQQLPGERRTRCELQNSQHNLSFVNNKFRDLELQMSKKDDSIGKLQSDLQECTKELIILKGMLPKVSEERNLMWEEVKQYKEKNMLLNSEVNILKKKIEALDEDILLKEGQITILKDTLGSRTFDLLASPDSSQDFLLK